MNNVSSTSIPEQIQGHLNEVRRGFKYKFIHPLDNLLTDINIGITTLSSLRNLCAFFSFISQIKPKYHVKALEHPN